MICARCRCGGQDPVAAGQYPAGAVFDSGTGEVNKNYLKGRGILWKSSGSDAGKTEGTTVII
jgi:hypothetical protein